MRRLSLTEERSFSPSASVCGTAILSAGSRNLLQVSWWGGFEIASPAFEANRSHLATVEERRISREPYCGKFHLSAPDLCPAVGPPLMAHRLPTLRRQRAHAST
jgi:hypothetical protein